MDKQNNTPKDIALNTPSRQEVVPLTEYSRLRDQYQALQERNYKLELERSLRRIGLYAAMVLGASCAWACAWVNTKFLLTVCFIALAVVAATLGSMWERRKEKGGENV